MNFTHSTYEEPRRRRGGFTRNQIIAIAAAGVLLLGALSTAVVFFVKYSNLKNKPVNAVQDLQERIPRKVAKLYQAPTETPTIAQVSDKDKLEREQGEFFAPAQNGDYIVIYPKAGLAVIYRESTDKIINTGPIDLRDQDSSSTQKTTQE